MNLLFLISSLHRGGAETHLVSLASSLAKQGHTITVISSGGELSELLVTQNVCHKRLPLHSKNPFSLLWSYFSLQKMLKANDYDLIHAHARIPAFLISRPSKKQRIPLITTVHASFRTTPLLRRFSRWGNYSIAVSEDLRQYLCEHYALCSQRIEVIPNGIDTEHFHPTSHQTKASCKRLVYLSRLDKDCAKVACLLCKIAPALRSHYPDLEIVIGGGGNAFSEIELLARKINQNDEKPLILLTGHLPDPRELYLSADAVIGVSRVALEAAACEIPVILAGNEGFLGILSPALFPKAATTNFCCRDSKEVTPSLLRGAISELFSMSEKNRKEMISRVADRIRTNCSIDAITQETLRVYRHVCQEFSHPSQGSLLFCGYYGYGNLGDHALLRAAIERARTEHPNLSLCAMTAHGPWDESLFGIRCVKRWHLLSLLRHIRSADLFVFGGGTLLQDRTSLRSLGYYVFLLRYAARHHIPTELWANGISPPRSKIAKRWIQSALSACRKIGLRDQTSLSLCQELCSKNENSFLVYEEDLALSTSSAKESRIQFLLAHYRLIEKDGKILRFAVLAPRGRESAGQIHIFSWWIGRLRSQGILPLFLPLFPKEDEPLCFRLAKKFGGRVARGLSEQDLVGLLHYAQMMASMRLHGLIFAKSAKIPFIGFGEDPKIEAFCREHGGRYWTEDI